MSDEQVASGWRSPRRVAVQFHPDWPFRDGMVIAAIANDRSYRSQFETGISNGGLTALPGGDRWTWESRRLRPEVTERSTFCFPDSILEPDMVVGPQSLPIIENEADQAESDDLDDYVEPHVHGGINLGRDVDVIVLDPCFRNSSVEQSAHSTGCDVA